MIKKNKRKYKSVITGRIVRSTKKIATILGCLILVLSMGKISDTNSFYADSASSSSNTFSAGYWIEPTVEVTSPSGGDEWQVGSTHNITWIATSSDPSKTAGMDIDINYRCGGGSWSNITNGTANDGAYSWIVPTNISDECEVRIFATDDYFLTGMDDSDEFEISYMVVLNEFVPYPASGLDEMVEIYNYGTEAIDVDDWFITDDNGPTTHRRLIDSSHTDTGNTLIDPASTRFLVIENYVDFYLNNTGSDEVRLYDDAGNLIDSHDFSDALQGKSYARIPDGVGNWVDPVPTPGEENNPSNDIEDMKKYYKKACFDDGEPICKESFLKSLGLLEEEKEEAPAEIITPIEEEIIPSEETEEVLGEEENADTPEEEMVDNNNGEEEDNNNQEEEEIEAPVNEVDEEIVDDSEEILNEEDSDSGDKDVPVVDEKEETPKEEEIDRKSVV